MFKALWHKYFGGKTKPWVDVAYEDNKLVVKNYNTAFVEDLKTKLGDLTDGKTDAEIVKLFGERETLEKEEPKLEVLHMGVDEEGRVKMQLDWNQAFIKHLRENGITAPTEDEAVEIYLMMLHRQVDGEFGIGNEAVVSQTQVDNAFADIDTELAKEMADAAAQARAQGPKKKGRRVNRTIDPNTNLPTNTTGF